MAATSTYSFGLGRDGERDIGALSASVIVAWVVSLRFCPAYSMKTAA